MKSKEQPAKKVLDVSRPKRRAVASDIPTAPQLVIPKRSIIPITEVGPETPTEPVVAKREAGSIQPGATQATTTAPEVPGQDAPVEEPIEDTITDVPTEEPMPKAAPATPTEPDITPAQDDSTDPKSSKADPHVRKAIEEAKRKQELQGYIDNREFFVPINAIARKRSIKVSVALLMVELTLGIILVNLMLDAGVIHLLEKIPHTNFFELQQ